MSCCNHKGNNGKKRHSHIWMMALCCGAPLLLLLAVSLLGAGFPGIKRFLLGIVPFICPLMMIAMLPMMLLHGKHGDASHEDSAGRPLPGKDGRDGGNPTRQDP